jgi:hypothetical protein
MTSISSLGSAGSPAPIDGPRNQRMEKVLDAVADKLGMKTSDLEADLQKGQSLTDIATSKGVSKDDLVSTIKNALGTDATDALATRIADHKGGHHHHHHHVESSDSSTTTQPGASTNPNLGANLDQTL